MPLRGHDAAAQDGKTPMDAAKDEVTRTVLRTALAAAAQAEAAQREAQRAAEVQAARRAAEVEAEAAQRAAEAEASRRKEEADKAAAVAAQAAQLGLSAAALAEGGAPCVVSAEYVCACTADFAADRVLGSPGAFGVVFRGDDAKLGLRFAVKRLSNIAPWPPERSAAREIEVLSRFRHPNIICLFGYTTEPAERCLLYELGDNGALSDALLEGARASRLTWRTRLRVAAGVAAALTYLHRSGPTPAWHRDVKAANVVLTAAWEPKLIDCGISKLLTPDEAARVGGITATGALAFGTPGYMCPTYVRRHKYDELAEVYSFGVLLCELLTGKVQLGGDGAGLDLVDEVAEEEGGLAAYRDARAGAPLPDDAVSALEALATQCVARKPAARPAMLTALRQLNALLAAHCAASAEEALLVDELTRMTAQRNALLAAIERAAMQHAPPRECCIFTACAERPLTLDDGLECAAGHFVCAGCLAAAVEARGDAAGRLGCLACAAAPFSDRELLLHLPERAGLRYLSQVTRAAEAAAARALEADFEARVVMAVGARFAQDGTALLRNQIIDDILTLRCPHTDCKKALPYEDGARDLPWDGCFAVLCKDDRGNGCKKHFCGWCFAPFPAGRHGDEGCHMHVAACARNAAPGRDVFGGPDAARLFGAELRTWRSRTLNAFLAHLPPAQCGPLLASLARELADAGLPHATAAAAEAARGAAARP
jgi:interleukin-1 receptor-associated kinase 4